MTTCLETMGNTCNFKLSQTEIDTKLFLGLLSEKEEQILA